MRNGYLKILIPEKMPKEMDVKRYHAIFWINLVTTSLDMMGMGWRQLSFTIPKIHVGQVWTYFRWKIVEKWWVWAGKYEEEGDLRQKHKCTYCWGKIQEVWYFWYHKWSWGSYLIEWRRSKSKGWHDMTWYEPLNFISWCSCRAEIFVFLNAGFNKPRNGGIQFAPCRFQSIFGPNKRLVPREKRWCFVQITLPFVLVKYAG